LWGAAQPDYSRRANLFDMALSRASSSGDLRRITEARGTALQPATLDIIDRAGLIEPFLRAGVRIRQVQLLGPGLQEISTTKFVGIGCKYEFQCSQPQWQTETILRDHLQSLGVSIEYGTEVKSIEDDPAGLRVTLETGGRTESFTAAYVLGAGGAHSVTRHSMQEHLDGETYDGPIYCCRRKSPPSMSTRMRPRHCGADRVRAVLAAPGRPLAYLRQSQ
jgi:2-polyprenyl-6-methoxyphenol hydroxylase-like FAD-dependent oxidoreductase